MGSPTKKDQEMHRIRTIVQIFCLAFLAWLSFRLYSIIEAGAIWSFLFILMTIIIAFGLVGLIRIYKTSLPPLPKFFLGLGAILAVPILALLVLAVFNARTAEKNIEWENYSPELISETLANGQPVFLNFTADWCGICHMNNIYIIETREVASTLSSNNILPVKVDWSNQSLEIGELLRRYGAQGIPFYVFHHPENPKPLILWGTLSKKKLLEAIAKVGQKVPQAAQGSTSKSRRPSSLSLAFSIS